jgi:hypothetical protein
MFVCVCVRIYSVFVLSCPCDGLITRPRSRTVCVKNIAKLNKREGERGQSPIKGL